MSPGNSPNPRNPEPPQTPKTLNLEPLEIPKAVQTKLVDAAETARTLRVVRVPVQSCPIPLVYGRPLIRQLGLCAKGLCEQRNPIGVPRTPMAP